LSPDELLTLADTVVGWARDHEQVEVVAAHSRDTEVRAYDGEIEAFTSADSSGVGIRLVDGHRQGFAHAGTLDLDALAETLTDARDNARFSTEDEHVGLAEPDGVATAQGDLYDERLATTPPDDKIAMALELDRVVRSLDPRVFGVESVDYADSIATTVVVSTTGVRSVSRESGCSLAAYSLAGADDQVTTGFGFSVGRGIDELDLESTARDAVDRAVRMLGAGRAPTQRLAVVFDPWVAAQFLAIVAEMFSGEAVLKGRSPFADRVGERVAAPGLTFVDDPTDTRWFGATFADGEGLATRPTTLIADGVAQGFLHDSYSARSMGVASTGSAVRHGYASTPSAGSQSVIVTPGTSTPDDILRSVGTGLYVADVQGLHSGVNPVSGDFSTGVEGLMIRGGELAEPVKEITIASTLQAMLGAVTMIGADATPMPLEAVGLTLAIGDVTLSGA
jgi:PmbA protein